MEEEKLHGDSKRYWYGKTKKKIEGNVDPGVYYRILRHQMAWETNATGSSLISCKTTRPSILS